MEVAPGAVVLGLAGSLTAVEVEAVEAVEAVVEAISSLFGTPTTAEVTAINPAAKIPGINLFFGFWGTVSRFS